MFYWSKKINVILNSYKTIANKPKVTKEVVVETNTSKLKKEIKNYK